MENAQKAKNIVAIMVFGTACICMTGIIVWGMMTTYFTHVEKLTEIIHACEDSQVVIIEHGEEQ